MITKTAEYALRAVTYLAANSETSASADVLSKNTQVPRRYLHRVLQDLVAGTLVDSKSGPGGGYSLSRPADQITILDVINSVSPIERINACPLGLKSHKELCPLHAELDKAYAATEDAFRNVTIRQLLDSTSSSSIPLCDLS